MIEQIRVDKWLWFARCCKTRAQAQRLVEGGLVTVNGRLVDKSSAVTPGDEIALALPGREGARNLRRLRVIAVGERRCSAILARTLYKEVGG